MHPSLVVLHPYKTSEYTDTVIYMDHIVSYIESGKVIQGQLLAFFNRPPDTYPVETVEYLVV